LRAPCCHTEPAIPIVGHGVTSWYRKKHGPVSNAERRAAMGIGWMTWDEIGDAIPPAYTEYIGTELLNYMTSEEAA
jgi:DNA (cytosine-5)-methyltransferase 1